MISDWQLKTLGDACEFYNGQAHEKVIDDNGKYIVVNSKFISSNGEILKKTNSMLKESEKLDFRAGNTRFEIEMTSSETKPKIHSIDDFLRIQNERIPQRQLRPMPAVFPL